MKIITEPHVHVLSIPRFFPHPEYQVPDVTVENFEYNDGPQLIAHAGKGCYDSYGKGGRSVENHIRQLVGSRHGSVLEHCNVSLFISGISRGCSHEIVRHRHFSYSQRSTRYTNEEDAAIVLDPYYAWMLEDAGANDDEYPEAVRLFLSSCQASLFEYKATVERLLEAAPQDKTKTEQRKWARGKARQLLPHALETRMTMTGNIRAWRHFLEERSSRHAEPEIRRLAHTVYLALGDIYPLLFEDYQTEVVDGYYELTTEFRKI